MTRIKIPDRYLSGLETIISLTDEKVGELLSALQDAPPKILPPILSQSIAPKVQSIPINDLTSIIDTLLSLYYTKLHHDSSPEEMAEDIFMAADESYIGELESFTSGREQLKTRLTKLLSVPSLDILSKALVVLRSNEKVFHDARIITDIRPVFGLDPEQLPAAAVILHMLNITYHHEGDIKELYIACDTDDLESLREVINRADLKAESLKSLLATANITNVTVD